jgi:hypothetical protein
MVGGGGGFTATTAKIDECIVISTEGRPRSSSEAKSQDFTGYK